MATVATVEAGKASGQKKIVAAKKQVMVIRNMVIILIIMIMMILVVRVNTIPLLTTAHRTHSENV